MPLKSEKQKKLFYAAAHNPEIAKKRDIPQSVAKEMISHDQNIHSYMDAVIKGDAQEIKARSDRFNKDGY